MNLSAYTQDPINNAIVTSTQNDAKTTDSTMAMYTMKGDIIIPMPVIKIPGQTKPSLIQTKVKMAVRR